MLETVREYGLEESEELQRLRRRHAIYFLELAEEEERASQGPLQGVWLDRLETGHDNLRTALSWSLTSKGDTEMGLKLTGALSHFWYVREHHSEARMWLQRALERPSEATAARAKVLSVPGDSPGSRESLGEAMCCSKKVSPYIGNWAMTRVLPLRYLAKSNFQRSLDISRDLEDAEGIALSLLYLGRRLRTSSSPLWGSAEAAGIPRRCTRSQRFAPI